MHSRFLLRFRAVLAAIVLAASSAFAQLAPDTPIAPAPTPGTSSSGSAARSPELAAMMSSIVPMMNAINEFVGQAAAPASDLGSRHALVVEALATANASPAVTNCVMSYYARETATATAQVRAQFAKILSEIASQRPKILSAWQKTCQQKNIDAGTCQSGMQDLAAVFDQMRQQVEMEQAKVLASLR